MMLEHQVPPPDQIVAETNQIVIICIQDELRLSQGLRSGQDLNNVR